MLAQVQLPTQQFVLPIIRHIVPHSWVPIAWPELMLDRAYAGSSTVTDST